MSKPATFESREQKDLQEFVFEATLAVLLHDPRNDYEDCVSPCLSLQFHVSCTRNRTHYARKCKGHNERRCTSSWSNFHFHIASLALPTWTTLQRRRDPSPKLSSIKSDEKQRQIAHASFFHTIHTLLLHWNRYNCVVSIVSVFPCFTYPCHFFRDVPINSRQSHLKSSQTPGKMHSWRKVLRPQKVFCLTSFQGASKKSQEFLVKKKHGGQLAVCLQKNNIWLFGEAFQDRQESISQSLGDGTGPMFIMISPQRTNSKRPWKWPGKKKQSWLKSSNHPPFLVLHFLVSGRVSSSFTGQISGSLTLFPVVGVQRDGNFLHFQASFIHLYLQRRQGGKKNLSFQRRKKRSKTGFRYDFSMEILVVAFFWGGGWW